MHTALQDLRRAFRTLWNSPGFTFAALATLTLGIGASTAIFTALDRVVLRPLPYDEADRLVYVDSRVRVEGKDAAWGVSEAGYLYLRKHNRTFDELGAYGAPGTDYEFTIAGPQGGKRVNGVWVTASLLQVLRLRPSIGRLIQEEDEKPGLPSVALLGEAFWRSEYGGDLDVIGRMLQLEGGWRVRVIGVLEADVHLPVPEKQVDVWVPLRLDPSRPPDRFHGYRVIGRLNPSATVDDATQDFARLSAQFPEALPQAYSEMFLRESGFSTRVTPLHARVIGGLRSVLWILLGSVGLVLLIGCTNVANLFLVRAEARHRDKTIRVALGASRQRLARQALSESLILTLVAAALGIWLASGAVRLLLAVAPADLPRLADVSVDGSSVAVALGIALAAGIAFGCLPLLHDSSDLVSLRTGGAGMMLSRRRQRVRGAMVVAQMALALVLLASAGLMLRSFERLRAVQLGLDPRNVLTVEVFLPAMHTRYQQPERLQQFYRDLKDRVANVSGVQEVGGGGVPLKDEPMCFATYLEGKPLSPGQQPPCIDLYTVTPGLFTTLRIPLQGREPAWAAFDQVEPPLGGEVVVTRALAERLWPGENPVGKGMRQAENGPPYDRVVGVTSDLRSEGLDRAPVEAVFGQMRWDRGMTLVVRTRAEPPAKIVAAVRSQITQLEPLAAVAGIQTMEDVLATSPAMARTSFTMLLLGIGAVMGLLLSAIGLFGVLAYLVGQRRGEIAIRMALGARRHEVATMIVRHSLRLAVAGAGLGLLSALVTTRLLRSLLYEVRPNDPLTLGAVTIVLVMVALVATYVPARRAARVDPMMPLRAE